MIEQERRDRELALRLTQDPDALDAEVQQAPQLPLQRWAEDTFFNSGISNILGTISTWCYLFLGYDPGQRWVLYSGLYHPFLFFQVIFSSFRALPPREKKKHDLSSWKYAELRDTINTSCGE